MTLAPYAMWIKFTALGCMLYALSTQSDECSLYPIPTPTPIPSSPKDPLALDTEFSGKNRFVIQKTLNRPFQRCSISAAASGSEELQDKSNYTTSRIFFHLMNPDTLIYGHIFVTILP